MVFNRQTSVYAAVAMLGFTFLPRAGADTISDILTAVDANGQVIQSVTVTEDMEAASPNNLWVLTGIDGNDLASSSNPIALIEPDGTVSDVAGVAQIQGASGHTLGFMSDDNLDLDLAERLFGRRATWTQLPELPGAVYDLTFVLKQPEGRRILFSSDAEVPKIPDVGGTASLLGLALLSLLAAKTRSGRLTR